MWGDCLLSVLLFIGGVLVVVAAIAAVVLIYYDDIISWFTAFQAWFDQLSDLVPDWLSFALPVALAALLLALVVKLL